MYVCGTIGGIRYVGVGVGDGKISYETGRRRGKARFQGSEQKRVVNRSRGVNRKEQSTDVGGRRWSEQSGRQVRSWDLWT